MKQVVEIVFFKLTEGVDVNLFKEASKAFGEEFLTKQPGFIKRNLIADGSGVWGDLAIWSSMETAQAVESAMQESECAGKYNSFIDFSTVDVKHFEVEQ